MENYLIIFIFTVIMGIVLNLIAATLLGGSALVFPLKAKAEEGTPNLKESDTTVFIHNEIPDVKANLKFSVDYDSKPYDEMLVSGGWEHTEEALIVNVKVDYNFNPQESLQHTLVAEVFHHGNPIHAYTLIKAGYKNVIDLNNWFKSTTFARIGALFIKEKFQESASEGSVELLSGLEQKVDFLLSSDNLNLTTGLELSGNIITSYYQGSFGYDNLTLGSTMFLSLAPFKWFEFYTSYGFDFHKLNPEFYFFEENCFSHNVEASAKFKLNEKTDVVFLYGFQGRTEDYLREKWHTLGGKLFLNKWFSNVYYSFNDDHSENSVSVGRHDKVSMEAFYSNSKDHGIEQELVGLRFSIPFGRGDMLENTAKHYAINRMLRDEFSKFHDFNEDVYEFLRRMNVWDLLDWWTANTRYIRQTGELPTPIMAYLQRGADCDGIVGALASFIAYLNTPYDAYVVDYWINGAFIGHGVLMIDDRKGRLFGYEYGQKLRIKAPVPTLEQKAELFLTKLSKFFAISPMDGALVEYMVYKGNPDLNKRYYDSPGLFGSFYYDDSKSCRSKPSERGIETKIGTIF